MDISLEHFTIAFAAALIPVLFWMWFWLREDKRNPEPWYLVTLAFLSGMVIIPLVLPLQHLALELYVGANLMLVWVIIEEALKYLIALLVVLWNKAVDEPIDLIMYMIFVALGFAALENTLFIYQPILQGAYEEIFITGGTRFLGATLLHVLASATIGIAMAVAFYDSKLKQFLFGTLGLFIAIVLHTLYNLSIMNIQGDAILYVFLLVWVGIIGLFLVFEKIKLRDKSSKITL